MSSAYLMLLTLHPPIVTPSSGSSALRIKTAAKKAKAIGLKAQGRRLRWEGIRGRKLTWKEMWRTKSYKLKFSIASVCNVLSSPTNLAIWKVTEDPSCPMCVKRVTVEHILSSCARSLASGKYSWPHDQVLETLAAAIDKARNRKPKKNAPRFIHFLRASTTTGNRHPSSSGKDQTGGILADGRRLATASRH